MDPFVNEIIEAFKSAYSAGGMLAIAGMAVMLSVRIYRTNPIQGMLAKYAPKAQWKMLPGWAKWLAPFAAAGLGAFVYGFATGQGVQAAVGAAISAAIGIVGHEGTKKAGELYVGYRLGKDPNYQPSPHRITSKVMSHLIPAPSETKIEMIKHRKGIAP